MTHRSPIEVLLLTFITAGIYGIFWLYWTKQEMNAQGAEVPTLFLVFLPFVSIWWLWKWSEGVDRVTRGQMSGATAFLLSWLLGTIGYAIVQDSFNKVSGTSVAT